MAKKAENKPIKKPESKSFNKPETKISALFEGLLKKIAEERGGDLVDCNISELDFSGDRFELESLDGLKYIS